jgi:glucose/mannose-6-phosphate isomerase
LAERAAAQRVAHWPIDDGGRAPRANMWSLAVPLLGLLDLLEIPVPLADLDLLADALDADGQVWATAPTPANAAKQWAHEFVDGLPLVWGTTTLGACAAYRTMAQLAENADLAALYGEVPEVNHNQVVTFEAGRGSQGLRLHLLRDRDEHPQVSKRADISAELARERGVPVTSVEVDGASPVVRFGRLVHRIDYATVFAAVLRGLDPCDITPITVLKERIAT